MTTDELRELCELVTQKLLHRLSDDLSWLRELGFGVTIFAFTFGPGAIGYLSTASREDMVRSIKEWLAYQEEGLETDPRGERGLA